MSERESGEPARRRRSRSSVSAEEILGAAERVAYGGLDGFTMRAVAAEIGASAMSLYRYFATKDQLVDAMLDRVLGRMETEPSSDSWIVDLTGFARAHRSVLADHPWAIGPLFTHSNPGANATAIGEFALEILERGGLTGADAVATFSGILALNYGWSSFSAAKTLDRPADMGNSISAERFPRTSAVADELSKYGSDSHYELVLHQLIDGIQATGEGH